MRAVPTVASTSAVIALVLATVWLVWPSQLGGATTYVTTHGTSMEPRFHTGDLAILSPADEYRVGDVVAYASESLDTIVMHRIVSGDAHGFTTQGDNNDWLDQDTPTQDEVLGRLFVRIPHGGEVLAKLRSPGALFSMAGVLLVVLGAIQNPRGRHSTRWVRHRVRVRGRVAAPTVSTRGRARQVAFGAGAAVLVAAVGCGVLLTLPPTQTDTRTEQVTRTSHFSYSGKAQAGTTYPTGVITTGDTVWTRLVQDMTVTLATAVSGPAPAEISGSLRLDVVVSAADGWSAVVGSGPSVPLEAGKATADVTVDADAATELLSRHYGETNSSAGSATLTVTPVSETGVTVHGQRVAVDSPPGLPFTLDQLALRPASAQAAALAPSSQTPVQIEEVAPRHLDLRWVSVPIGTARKAMGALLLLSLLVLGVASWIGRIGRGTASDRFLMRHADRIVPVASFSPGPTVIDLADAESLHRVAERFDALVLHQAGPDGDVFAVRDVDATYRFVVPGGRAAREKPPVPVAVRPRNDLTAPLPRVTPSGPVGQAA